MASINLLLIITYIVLSIVLVYVLPKKRKWYALLCTSIFFYYVLVGSKILFLILFSLIIYKAGFFIHKKRFRVTFIIIGILLPLIVSKFLISNSHFENYSSKHITFTSWSTILQIIGISYITFNAISYLIDIKKKFIKPEGNFFFLLLYLIYFPAIFSGPLHRFKYLTSQFKNITITSDSLSSGLRLILWGLFKNMVIAQRIFSIFVTLKSSDISGAYYLLLGLLFFLYLYCNFSSFIDFFQGVSQIFNIKLKNNFRNRIYVSASRQEFWKGWHITLNEWFRDYFFFMLAKKDKKRKYTDYILLLTFLLIALWHEISITLLIWGLCNASWIILEKKVDFQKFAYPKLRKLGGVFYHLFFSSLLALIFISNDFHSLFLKIFFTPSTFPIESMANHTNNIVIIMFSFLIMDYHFKKAKKERFDDYIGSKKTFNRWFIYFKLTLIILIFGATGGIDNYYILF